MRDTLCPVFSKWCRGTSVIKERLAAKGRSSPPLATISIPLCRRRCIAEVASSSPSLGRNHELPQPLWSTAITFSTPMTAVVASEDTRFEAKDVAVWCQACVWSSRRWKMAREGRPRRWVPVEGTRPILLI